MRDRAVARLLRCPNGMKGTLARRNDKPGVNYRRQRPSRQIDTRAARLSERHELTPQEARVALLIADGSTVTEIAGALDVTVFTVRAHLRNIFAKMGVARQAALVRVVLTATGAREPGVVNLDNCE